MCRAVWDHVNFLVKTNNHGKTLLESWFFYFLDVYFLCSFDLFIGDRILRGGDHFQVPKMLEGNVPFGSGGSLPGP